MVLEMVCQVTSLLYLFTSVREQCHSKGFSFNVLRVTTPHILKQSEEFKLLIPAVAVKQMTITTRHVTNNFMLAANYLIPSEMYRGQDNIVPGIRAAALLTASQ